MDKKGNVLDVLDTYISIFVFLMVILIAGVVYMAVGNGFLSSGFFPAEANAILMFLINYPRWFDWAVPVIYLGSFVFSIISARLIPVTRIGYIVGTVSALFVAMGIIIFTYIGQQYLIVGAFSGVVDLLIFTPAFFTYGTYFGMFYLFGVLIALYAKD